ncbi:MAG: ROK family glucokinase [Candidatus Izemoplasmatales bacterium]
MKKYLVGIDIGGTSIKIGLFDLSGSLLEKWDIPTNKTNKGELILSEIAESIQSKIRIEEVHGIGFGVPGPVTKDIVFSTVNLGWTLKNVKEEFYQIVNNRDFHIRVSNDANTATAGELYQGVAKGYNNVAMFTLGTGIGGGIVLNGKIIDGINGVAGEVGHIVVDQEHQFQCNCGKKGCLETVASATGIVRLAEEYLRESNESSLLRHAHHLSAKKVIDAAKEGDSIALKTLSEAAHYLAYSMAMITNIINPDIIVIGGGVSNAGQILIDLIEEFYYQYTKPFINHTNFAIASLGNDAGIYGAAYMVRL